MMSYFMSFVLKNSKRYHKSFKCYLVFELTADAPALQGAQSDHLNIPFKISIKREEK